MGETGQANRQSEVSEQMGLVEKKLGCITDALVQLEERLKPALRAIAPAITDAPDKAKEKELCILASSLKTFKDRAGEIMDKIYSIRDRIEL